MSTVNSNIKIGKKDAAFFAANPALVLLNGQLIYNETTGDLFIGDGVTPLIGLTPINAGFTPSGTNLDYIAGDGSYIIFPTDNAAFTNGAGYLSSGDISVTVQAYDGDTTILGNGVVGDSVVVTDSNGLLDSVTLASGESIRRNALDTAFEGFTALTSGDLAPYLTSATAALTYQPIGTYLTPSDIGVTVQAYSANTTLLGNSTTGSGSIVLATSPTFGTSIFSPIVYGSSLASSNLTLASTSNATKGVIQIGTTDLVNIGNRVTTNQRLVRIGQDTGWVDIGSLIGSTSLGAIYINQATPSGSNYTMSSTGSNLLINTTDAISFRVSDSNRYTISSAGQVNTWSPATASSGAITNFILTCSINTGQTASTNIPNFRVNGSTKTWAAGTLATQYFNYFTANTVAFASASTATMPVNLYVEAPLAGANCTATNLAAIGCGGHLFIANSVGVPANNPTGGGLLYVEAGALKYRGSSGTVTTIANA